MTEKRLLGEILVRSGLLTAELLQDALDMQSLVIKEVITKDEAAFVLRQAVADKQSVFQVLKNRKSLQDAPATAGQALDLLIKAKTRRHNGDTTGNGKTSKVRNGCAQSSGRLRYPGRHGLPRRYRDPHAASRTAISRNNKRSSPSIIATAPAEKLSKRSLNLD